MLTYTQSLLNIIAAEANYQRLCELAETDDAIGEALGIFHQAKKIHTALFGAPTKRNGEWF